MAPLRRASSSLSSATAPLVFGAGVFAGTAALSFPAQADPLGGRVVIIHIDTNGAEEAAVTPPVAAPPAAATDTTPPATPAISTPPVAAATNEPTTDVPAADIPAADAPDTDAPDADAAPDDTTPAVTPGAGAATDIAPGARPDEVTPSEPAASPTPASSKLSSRLIADQVTVKNGIFTAHSDDGREVLYQSGPLRLFGNDLQLDTNTHTVTAPGEARVERHYLLRQRLTDATTVQQNRYRRLNTADVLRGRDFVYNFETGIGKLDDARMVTASFNLTAPTVTIRNQHYTAHNVVVRPGGLTPEEEKIYGKPPFSVHATTADVDDSDPDNTGQDPQLRVKGAGFYVGGLRLFPVPSALLSRSLGGREQETYSLTPRVSFSSSDGVLVTTQLAVPINQQNPSALSVVANLGLSQRVGFRGGLELKGRGKYGRFEFGGLVNDVVTTQLTDRIELDRLPELSYNTPTFKLFGLPGGRRAGIILNGVIGRYHESETGGGPSLTASRQQAGFTLTTRVVDRDGPYAEFFGRTARYGGFDQSYNYLGFETGYIGKVLPHVVGQFSYRTNSIDGDTPFRFDRVQIRHELRSTFDIGLSPRYILPFDLRYDLDRNALRDARFGILRSYKNFAYGVSYQTARHNLFLDLRQAF